MAERAEIEAMTAEEVGRRLLELLGWRFIRETSPTGPWVKYPPGSNSRYVGQPPWENAGPFLHYVARPMADLGWYFYPRPERVAWYNPTVGSSTRWRCPMYRWPAAACRAALLALTQEAAK